MWMKHAADGVATNVMTPMGFVAQGNLYGISGDDHADDVG